MGSLLNSLQSAISVIRIHHTGVGVGIPHFLSNYIRTDRGQFDREHIEKISSIFLKYFFDRFVYFGRRES